MKRFLFALPVLPVLALSACTTTVPIQKSPEMVKNQFQATWDEVAKDELSELPQEKVSFSKLVAGGKNIILGNAQRTLSEHANILKPFDKLAHPNGICFKGVWNVDTENKYSGYFKNGSSALIIVRASTAMSNTKRDGLRAFGFAGKLFPTMDPTEVIEENSANFFLVDDLGGTSAAHYTDVALSNEPETSITSVVLKSLLYTLKVARTFSKADKNPGIRQVYEISHLGEANIETAVTPRWMKVEAKQWRISEAPDFRDELKLAAEETLEFSVSVASEQQNDQKMWETIGTITLDTSVVSASCDHQLHFHHPLWKEDLIH